jgi:hypothetical protein
LGVFLIEKESAFDFIWNSRTVAAATVEFLVDYLDSLMFASLPCVCVCCHLFVFFVDCSSDKT